MENMEIQLEETQEEILDNSQEIIEIKQHLEINNILLTILIGVILGYVFIKGLFINWK